MKAKMATAKKKSCNALFQFIPTGRRQYVICFVNKVKHLAII